MRLGIVKTWDSRWFAGKDYPQLLKEDLFIRKYLKSRLHRAGISRFIIERAPKKITITIHTARPGMVIGRKGAEVDQIRDELQHLTKKEIYINIQEVKRPEVDAALVAEHVAHQLEQRVAFRRAMKKAMSTAMRAGAQGIRICSNGRLGGAEMSRTEWYREGRVPLHTFRADIDFARATAMTTYGTVGVKVWVFREEVFDKRRGEAPMDAGARRAPRREDAMHPRPRRPGGPGGASSGGRPDRGEPRRERPAPVREPAPAPATSAGGAPSATSPKPRAGEVKG
jgi:small subunit ribosomal protein S3